MADLSRPIAQYLASLAGRRWAPGVLDCGVFMADWVRQVTGVDPIADVRGKYDTERQFTRIVRSEGGFEESCKRRLGIAGYLPTVFPMAGDIAVVLSPYAVRRGVTQTRPTGAVVVDCRRRAVITSDMGVVIAGEERLPLLSAWRWHG